MAAYALLLGRYRESARDVEQARGLLPGSMLAYQAGESELTDLLDTLRVIYSTEMTHLALLASTLETHRKTELAAGRPLTEGDAR